MASPAACKHTWYSHVAYLFSGLWRYERQGVDVVSACSASFTHHRRSASRPARTAVVLAAPQQAFHMQKVALEHVLPRPQMLAVLHSRGMLTDETVMDVMIEPRERTSVAVFSLNRAQCDVWQQQYTLAHQRVVAIEPAGHALWRYAQQQHVTQQAWLIATAHSATLYWPAEWPWGYHTEPLPLEIAEYAPSEEMLQATVRRAALMTGNDAPLQQPICVAGTRACSEQWQSCTHSVVWQAVSGVHPIAAGAALKSARRWV